MPYISQVARLALKIRTPHDAGELNYAVTQLILAFLGGNPHYEDYNTVLGVLEAVKLELYRRAIAPYEDWKMAENGDVYS